MDASMQNTEIAYNTALHTGQPPAFIYGHPQPPPSTVIIINTKKVNP